jgi:hypothetical protein
MATFAERASSNALSVLTPGAHSFAMVVRTNARSSSSGSIRGRRFRSGSFGARGQASTRAGVLMQHSPPLMCLAGRSTHLGLPGEADKNVPRRLSTGAFHLLDDRPDSRNGLRCAIGMPVTRW